MALYRIFFVALAFSSGWPASPHHLPLLISDLGKLTNRGKLIISGRTSDMIIKGGVNLAPAQIEHILLQHPLVRDCHIVGVNDARLGEEVCAFICGATGLTKDEVWRFARERVSIRTSGESRRSD